MFTGLCLSMLINKKGVTTLLEQTVTSQSLLWMWGFLALTLGAIIVVLNNSCIYGLPLVITILGWLTLVKGLLLLFFPNSTISVYKKWSGKNMISISGIIGLILGLILLYVSFM